MEKIAHKAGFVNIIGNPNVGKSTLMNTFVGEKLSIITPKAQTTRHRIVGIVNDEHHQIVFSDTPGIINPAYELQTSMMNFVKEALEDADVLIYMVEIGEKRLKNETLFQKLNKTKVPLLLLLNKVDTSSQETLEKEYKYWEEQFPQAQIHPISATKQFNTQNVLTAIRELLPVAEPFYDKDALTDKPQRFFVNEVVREKILLNYGKEVPYSVEVVTEEFVEKPKIIDIRIIIVTERETQKAILLGHKGESIKRVGRQARIDLEKFFDKKIFLQIFIKTIKDWRNKKNHLDQFGYNQS